MSERKEGRRGKGKNSLKIKFQTEEMSWKQKDVILG